MNPKMKKPILITSLVSLSLVLVILISIIAISATQKPAPVGPTASEETTQGASGEAPHDSSEAPEQSASQTESSQVEASQNEKPSNGEASQTERPSTERPSKEQPSKEQPSREEPSKEQPSKPGPINMSDKEVLNYVYTNELAYLASMQLDNGALPMTKVSNGTVSMNPYFADTAATALLTAGKKYQNVVKKYIVWHMNHLNTKAEDYNGVDGTIYDYTILVENGKAKSESHKKSYDSTDSYAATFLSVLRMYAEKTGDKAFLQQYYNQVGRIYSAMISTMSPYNLTYAKPDYRAEYLMDNCEVYKGAEDAAWLYRNVFSGQSGASSKASAAQATADKVKTAIQKLWIKKYNCYQMHRGGGPIKWNTFYADATCQMFPVLFGIDKPTDDRSQYLYNEFNKYYGNGKPGSDWQHLDLPETFYWGLLPRWASIMDDDAAVVSYARKYKTVMKRHAWPLYNSDIAHVAIACYNVLNNQTV